MAKVYIVRLYPEETLEAALKPEFEPPEWLLPFLNFDELRQNEKMKVKVTVRRDRHFNYYASMEEFIAIVSGPHGVELGEPEEFEIPDELLPYLNID